MNVNESRVKFVGAMFLLILAVEIDFSVSFVSTNLSKNMILENLLLKYVGVCRLMCGLRSCNLMQDP